ncbi:hypothetical protein Cgig2_010865 [Carnegiea gigantea]|uniref:BHLH domain-containing protein n=1 Tax=Carnegiea gigantea TaxID=171969 RepID=A0A9Q1GSD7_9CARY|nr:hypothetical protein Cgig2_010865 [Carnegiea gigantea]
MLSFSPFFSSNLRWENTVSSSNMNLDCIVPIFSPLFQALEGENLEFETNKLPHRQGEGQDLQFVHYAGEVGLGLEDSPRSQQKSASSAHESRHGYSELAKKLNHNARERDRRKRMNASYYALRALLPAPLHQKEGLSIPETVSLVADYIPQLQQEVESLLRKKEELVSKISAIQGVGRKPSCEEEKETRKKRASVCAISVEKLGEREIIIRISTYERVSLPDVLLLLESHGFMVLNIEERANDIVKRETLNEELLAMIKGGAQARQSDELLVNKKEPRSDLITFDPHRI